MCDVTKSSRPISMREVKLNESQFKNKPTTTDQEQQLHGLVSGTHVWPENRHPLWSPVSCSVTAAVGQAFHVTIG